MILLSTLILISLLTLMYFTTMAISSFAGSMYIIPVGNWTCTLTPYF